MKKPNITELIRRRRVYLDGAMGTMLQKAGLLAGSAPESWNLENPSEVLKIHKAYLEAGCDVITTNTFGVNPLKYENWRELTNAAVSVAKEAAEDFSDRYVALDIGPTGQLLQPLGNLSFNEAVRAFGMLAKYGEELGVDLILIETMNDSYETKAALLAAKENTKLPVFVTNVYDAAGKLMTGANAAAMIALLEGLGADAIGMNCSLGPDKMLGILPQFSSLASVPIIAMPNAGLPCMKDGKTFYEMGPVEFSSAAVGLAKGGAFILGGCCGTTPECMKLVIEKTKVIPLPLVTDKNKTLVSSYSHAVEIGKAPLLIGERINPTGKKKFKSALIEHDLQYILNEGLREEKAGVELLDVNVGLPEIDEKKVLTEVTVLLQGVTDLPLQLDSSDPAALESALRVYNGKALVNSVNGTEKSMSSVLPLIKKYGGAVIALTLDENGIPKTALERVAVAERIIRRAGEYGVAQKEIIVDPLALTISSEPDGANVTLEALRLLKEKGIRTSLGVSNISFGLPQRDKINAVFFACALEAGLSLAIMNPFSEAMTDTYFAFCALRGLDVGCKAYISHYEAQNVDASLLPTKKEESETLSYMIEKGLKEKAAAMADELLKTRAPLDVIDTEIIPALNRVGAAFEKGKAFLPQLLMSADAASAAFASMKKKMPAAASDSKRSVVLATVIGDIHDIGKNIVRVLLESYGFCVYDLGRDVPPQRILQFAVEKKCNLIGLSALMTTTVPAMSETVRLLKENLPDCRVMVGGAVLTQEYADQMKADVYCSDAMNTVRYAEQFYNNY